MAGAPEEAQASLEMLRSVGGNEMLAMMLSTFVEFADERIPVMLADVAAGRLKEGAAVAHSLKSSARQLGAMPLGDACELVETAGKAGDAAACADGVSEVQLRYPEARDWMQAIATAS